jgi:hypothetical protein
LALTAVPLLLNPGVAELIGAYRALVDVDDDEIGAAITKLWGHAKPTTWNRNRAAVGSWLA